MSLSEKKIDFELADRLAKIICMGQVRFGLHCEGQISPKKPETYFLESSKWAPWSKNKKIVLMITLNTLIEK